MKIWTLSDLHFDHHVGGAKAYFNSTTRPAPSSYDVAVITGDIGNPVMSAIADIAEHCAQADRPLIYTPGNHDGYRGLAGTRFEFTFWEEQMAMLREFAAQNNVIVLDRESGPVVIDGVRFVGATGWPEFAPELVPAGMSLRDAMMMSEKGRTDDGRYGRAQPHNDFREIRVGAGNSRHRMTPSIMRAWAKADHDYLAGVLASPHAGDTVVVTHVGPASQVEPGNFAWLYGSRANEDLIVQRGVDLWVHGHTHRSHDLTIGETRVVSNARGYPSENLEFDPALVVAIEPKPEPTLTWGM